jgi:hypothetical protein
MISEEIHQLIANHVKFFNRTPNVLWLGTDRKEELEDLIFWKTGEEVNIDFILSNGKIELLNMVIKFTIGNKIYVGNSIL